MRAKRAAAFSPTPVPTRIVNFSDAITYGAEIAGRARLTETLDLDLDIGLGLLDTEIRDRGSAAFGNEIGLDPEVTLVAGVVREPLPDLELSGSLQYVSEYFGSFQNRDDERSGTYVLPPRTFGVSVNLKL